MKKPDTEIHIIDCWEDWEAFRDYVDDENFDSVAFDLESDSIIEVKAAIMGIGLCFQPGQAFYIPIRQPDKSLAWTESQHTAIHTTISGWLQNKRIITQNGAYDSLVWESNYEVVISDNISADTILMKHMIDEEPPFGLKEVSVRYLGDWADKAQDALKNNVLAKGGRWVEEQKDMWMADTAILGEYCAWDVLLTRWLHDLFAEKIDTQDLRDLFESETMPLYREVTINMKRQGFAIDIEHFTRLKEELEAEICKVEDEVQEAISDMVAPFCEELLNREVPIRPSLKWAQALSECYNIPLPINKKTGKTTLAAKPLTEMQAVIKDNPEQNNFYSWLLEQIDYPTGYDIDAIQKKLFLEKNETRYIFNLSSTAHLVWLFFTQLGLEPLSHTEGGKPQCDDDFLISIEKEYPFVSKLLDYKRLNKLLSTYCLGILSRQVDGIVYASMLQFGTTSGRFSCRSPNLQNLPRVKEDDSGLSPLVLHYVNEIKRGFVAPEGFILVDADYSALEPRCFSSMSGDPALQQVFKDNLDLYSQVAIRTFNLEGVSADKNDPNYLGKTMKEKRQIAKVIALAIAYGAEAGRISQLLGISWQEANEIVENYLEAFPMLRKYIENCHYQARHRGQVTTTFGRIRHLQEAVGLHKRYGFKIMQYQWARERGLTKERALLKNLLNNSTNFPIQGLAAHIVNRSMLAIAREFKRHGIEGHIIAQIHDQITCKVRKEQKELACKIVKDCMENTTLIAVPLIAEPNCAENWADAKL